MTSVTVICSTRITSGINEIKNEQVVRSSIVVTVQLSSSGKRGLDWRQNLAIAKMLEIRELEDDLRTVKSETVTQVESYAGQPNQVSESGG